MRVNVEFYIIDYTISYIRFETQIQINIYHAIVSHFDAFCSYFSDQLNTLPLNLFFFFE